MIRRRRRDGNHRRRGRNRFGGRSNRRFRLRLLRSRALRNIHKRRSIIIEIIGERGPDLVRFAERSGTQGRLKHHGGDRGSRNGAGYRHSPFALAGGLVVQTVCPPEERVTIERRFIMGKSFDEMQKCRRRDRLRHCSDWKQWSAQQSVTIERHHPGRLPTASVKNRRR